MALQNTWKKHLRLSLIVSALPGLILYLLPFIASSYTDNGSYHANGLYLVYRENILRYFQPFDHRGPIYTYFIYLPLYLMPWAYFFFPALLNLPTRWRALSLNMKWVALTLLILFLFFTLSGSRRNYYVLPMVPFAILLTAEWICAEKSIDTFRKRLAAACIITTYVLWFAAFAVLPAWYYSQYGVERFSRVLKTEATERKPWSHWNIVLLDAESKINFYLHLAPDTKNWQIKRSERNRQTSASLLQMWPLLANKPKNTIFITRKQYLPLLRDTFSGYRLIQTPSHSQFISAINHELAAPIAFVPENFFN